MTINPIKERKIIVIGPAGSGKSRFCKILAELTALPLIHLDNIYYHQDGTTIGNNAFDQILEDILSKEEAIIDGHYFRTIEQRIKWSDLCFLFDLSKEEVLQGLKDRLGSDSENCPFIRKEEDIEELMQAWERFDQTNRNIILNYLKDSPKTRLVIFKSRKEVDEYISNLKR